MSKTSGPFLMVDPDRCTACRTCELACAAAHTQAGTLMGAILADEPLAPRNRVVQVAGVRFPTQCRQCEDAPCVRVCPTGATYRTETYTAVNPNLCIACKLCMMVCPFGAIQTATIQLGAQSKRAAIKCDLCNERVGGPACVESCPTQAISMATPRKVMQTAVQTSAERFLDALKAQNNLRNPSAS